MLNTRINDDNKPEVFDPVRNIYVPLTPEESVRQKLIMFLNVNKQVPLSLMGVEKQISVNNLAKRPDIIVYNRDGKAIMIAECKAPDVKISTEVLNQALRYNITLKVDFLILTNGCSFYMFDCRNGKIKAIDVNAWKYVR